MVFKQLPLIAGQVLHRIGRLNILEQSESFVEEKIVEEQKRRTFERKAAQIARAEKDKR